MNDRRNRAPVKARIVDLAVGMGTVDLGVEGRDAEVIDVSYDLPPDTATENCIYFGAAGPVEGESTPAAISSKGTADDVFAVIGKADVFGFESAAEAEEACERVLNALDTRLAACSRLIHPDDDTLTEMPVWDVEKAYITASSLLSGKTDGGLWAARYEFTVQCTSNIRY